MSRASRSHCGLPDETRHFYYNNQWQVLEERVGTLGASAQVDKQYVYHPDYVDAIAVRFYDENTDGDLLYANEGEHYCLQDANYNVTAVTDNAGAVTERYSYTPYGEVTILDESFSPVNGNTSTIANEYLYTSRRRDPETGLQLNRNRFYHQQLGRWVNRDPIGYIGTNLYNYVASRPTYFVDPLGLTGGEPQRPDQKPKRNCPRGTKPIDEHEDTKDIVHRIKDNLRDYQVGPKTWVGVTPDGDIILPTADGDSENVGPWENFYPAQGQPTPWWQWFFPFMVPAAPAAEPVVAPALPIIVVPMPLLEPFLPLDPKDPA